jgi:hypothetical protein
MHKEGFALRSLSIIRANEALLDKNYFRRAAAFSRRVLAAANVRNFGFWLFNVNPR